MPVTDDYSVNAKQINFPKLKELLIEKHSFSKERTESTLQKLEHFSTKTEQQSLGDFF